MSKINLQLEEVIRKQKERIEQLKLSKALDNEVVDILSWENDGGAISWPKAPESTAISLLEDELLSNLVDRNVEPLIFPLIPVKESVLEGELQAKIHLNSDQNKGKQLAFKRTTFCFIGPAGTGKTTAMRVIIQDVRNEGLIGTIQRSTKYLRKGNPSVVVVSYTNKAVENIRRGMPKDVHCITIHKLLEFAPEFYEVMDSDGRLIKTMRFEPTFDRHNKLPSIDLICIEESGSVDTKLFGQLIDALPTSTQFIYMGDINQLPPVYGNAILGYRMLDSPVVELKEVMRQALESPILAFAWEILKGKPLSIKMCEEFNKENEFKVRPWKKKLSAHNAFIVASNLLNGFTDNTGKYHPGFVDSGEYNPMEDMILIPYGKNRSGDSYFCTNELNATIAQKLGTQRDAKVYEIIAGFQKFYYAVGDKLFVNKQEVVVKEIKFNDQYLGKRPIDASEHLNRWGQLDYITKEAKSRTVASSKEYSEIKEFTQEEVDNLMALAAADSGELEERKNQASHVLVCTYLDSDDEIEIRTTGEYMESQFAYALTVHKAQGSEWKRVILLLHNSHDRMISRELLYTAVTRARESLYVICEPYHFEKGILRQRIKGNTLEEKAEYFKGKLSFDLKSNQNGDEDE